MAVVLHILALLAASMKYGDRRTALVFTSKLLENEEGTRHKFR